jgi:putative ABC transport system permease protein
MVDVLDIKVVRDLWSLRLQVLSIALLVAAGVAVFVMSMANYDALVVAIEAHYRQERFADLVAPVVRAPIALADQARLIDGVGSIEPRIVKPVRVLRADTDRPISGLIVSIPSSGQPSLNRIRMIEGRWPDPRRYEEVVINAAYAEARRVRIGETIDVVINSRLQPMRVVGIGLSPEFVFATRSAVPFPDDRNFVVMWAAEDAVANAFDMSGAFNELLVGLAPGAMASHVVDTLDDLLAVYGGTGTYDRADHPSHRFLADELAEQQTLSIFMPAFFFGIATFLLNVVVGRLIEAQRGQIAALKAMGVGNGTIALHFFKFVTLVALLGLLLGVLLGRWFSIAVSGSYRTFFRLPSLEPQLPLWLIVVAAAVTLIAANAAVAASIARLARLPPAQAMLPAAPHGLMVFGWLQRGALSRLPLKSMMALRAMVGRPMRTVLVTTGIALALPLILFGFFWFDAIDYLIDVGFIRIERGDILVSFTMPVSADAESELLAIPGVMEVELQRAASVILNAGGQSYRTAAIGQSADGTLRVPRDSALHRVELPASGAMISTGIAEQLDVVPGDLVSMEFLQGRRPVRTVPIVQLSDDLIGGSVTFQREELNQLLREGPLVTSASLRIDPDRIEQVWAALNAMPMIESASAKALWISLFRDTVGNLVIVGAVILVAFGILIAVGVVYNTASITVQERGWELASLRIIGLTRLEVLLIVISELAVEVIVAIPAGLWIGWRLIELMISVRQNRSFSIPPVVEVSSYGLAALILAAAASASAFVIKRRVDGLDLVSVLKARDG